MSFGDWDATCMALALDEARRAADRGEVPVGAVLTKGDKILPDKITQAMSAPDVISKLPTNTTP